MSIIFSIIGILILVSLFKSDKTNSIEAKSSNKKIEVTKDNDSNYRTIKFLVLSKSAKDMGYCVAGIDVEKNILVRLVSNATGDKINKWEFIIDNNEIEILDVIEVVVVDAPLILQKENLILKKIIRKISHETENNLLNLYSKLNNGSLLNPPFCLIYEDNKQTLVGSIMVAKVSNLTLFQMQTPEGKTKTKCSFIYNSVKCKEFAITDPIYFNKEENIKNAILLISVSEHAYHGKYYKFIAKIIPLSDKHII